MLPKIIIAIRHSVGWLRKLTSWLPITNSLVLTSLTCWLYQTEIFRQCSQFLICDVEDMNIATVDSPGHQPGYLPIFLKEKGVNLVIAGGMGQKAKDIFASQAIQTITGINLATWEAIKLFKMGELKGTGETCTHSEEHDCHHD